MIFGKILESADVMDAFKSEGQKLYFSSLKLMLIMLHEIQLKNY